LIPRPSHDLTVWPPISSFRGASKMTFVNVSGNNQVSRTVHVATVE
jgi:hypothetical protein